MSLLSVENLVAGYGPVDILQGVSLAVERGQIAVVIGPNGAGKSTLMKAIFGLAQVRGGRGGPAVSAAVIHSASCHQTATGSSRVRVAARAAPTASTAASARSARRCTW